MLGAHIPVSEGFKQLFEYAEKLTIQHVQIFTASNRQIAIDYIISDKKLAEFYNEKKQYPHITLYSHAGYLMNLASHEAESRNRSINMLLSELYRCDQLGVKHVVIHPGSNKNREEGLKNITDSLNNIYEKYTGSCVTLLESSAGQGSTLPCQTNDLEILYKKLHTNKHIGLCIDTCHAHASGYDMSNVTSVNSYFETINELWGYKKIYLIHINDSMKECCSNIDRHDNIGKGTIGKELMRHIVRMPHLSHIPKILETPFENVMDYQHDLTALRDGK